MKILWSVYHCFERKITTHKHNPHPLPPMEPEPFTAFACKFQTKPTVWCASLSTIAEPSTSHKKFNPNKKPSTNTYKNVFVDKAHHFDNWAYSAEYRYSCTMNIVTRDYALRDTCKKDTYQFIILNIQHRMRWVFKHFLTFNKCVKKKSFHCIKIVILCCAENLSWHLPTPWMETIYLPQQAGLVSSTLYRWFQTVNLPWLIHTLLACFKLS